MPKLNKSAIDNAKVPEKGDNWIWDSEVEGFGIRVQASGRKTYVARYRNKADGIQRKSTLARCSDMPPDKARDLARKLFTKVADGQDPVAERRIVEVVEVVRTVADLSKAFLEKHAMPFKKATSVASDEATWRLHIVPHLGARDVKSITEEDVLDVVAALKNKPAVGNQVVAVLSKAFGLAEKWKWRERNTNPVKGVKKYKLRERETILSPAEIGRLDGVISDMLDKHEISKPMSDLVRLLMLTGCRLREIMHAKRAWLDVDRCLLLLPDSKVGQRKIALSPPAMAIMLSIPAEQEWLIPGNKAGAPLITPYKPWNLLKERAGLPDELRMHDLRHSFGSLAHMAGMNQKQIASALGHKQLSTTERYLHGRAGDSVHVAAAMGDLITKDWKKPAADIPAAA